MTKREKISKVISYCLENGIWDIDTATKFGKWAPKWKEEKVDWWFENMENLKDGQL
jgi:predicted aldo/keto reductase-like oxidoreductase